MQELTRIALLAEPSEPVLADGRESLAFARVGRELFWWLEVCGRGRSMPQRAVKGPEGAAGWGEREAAYLVVWRGWVSCVRERNRRCAPLSSLMPSSFLT